MSAIYVFEELSGGLSQGREEYPALSALKIAAQDWAEDFKARHGEWPVEGHDYRAYRQDALDLELSDPDAEWDVERERRAA